MFIVSDALHYCLYGKFYTSIYFIVSIHFNSFFFSDSFYLLYWFDNKKRLPFEMVNFGDGKNIVEELCDIFHKDTLENTVSMGNPFFIYYFPCNSRIKYREKGEDLILREERGYVFFEFPMKTKQKQWLEKRRNREGNTFQLAICLKKRNKWQRSLKMFSN